MPTINFKPTTAARRNMSVMDYKVLTKKAPEKSLLESLPNKSGRNNYGRITVRHRGGKNRRKYRIIDFKRQKLTHPLRYSALSTTRTAPHLLPWCSTRTAKKATSSRRKA
jgi:large subunit ribosomal protein L2